MRRVGLVGMVVALVMAFVPQAGAALWSGACLVNVRFNFSTPVRAVGTAPNYSVNVSSVADVDPLKSGTQGCAVTLDPLEIGRGTAVERERDVHGVELRSGGWFGAVGPVVVRQLWLR